MLASSFACRLVRFSSLRLVWRLVVCSSCPAGWGGVACLLVSSWSFFSCCVAGRPFSSRAASRSRLVVASRWRIVIGDLPVAVALHACGSPGLRLVSRLVERGGFGFSYYHRREWIGDGSRLAVSGPVLACLLRRRGRAMPFSSSEFPPAPYRPMAAGRGAVRRPPFGSSLPTSRSRWLSLLPRAAHSIRGGRDGRLDGGCLLGYRHVAYRVSSIDVYNEYDICDVYKRYKDTMIREYDGYMG